MCKLLSHDTKNNPRVTFLLNLAHQNTEAKSLQKPLRKYLTISDVLVPVGLLVFVPVSAFSCREGTCVVLGEGIYCSGVGTGKMERVLGHGQLVLPGPHPHTLCRVVIFLEWGPCPICHVSPSRSAGSLDSFPVLLSFNVHLGVQAIDAHHIITQSTCHPSLPKINQCMYISYLCTWM